MDKNEGVKDGLCTFDFRDINLGNKDIKIKRFFRLILIGTLIVIPFIIIRFYYNKYDISSI